MRERDPRPPFPLDPSFIQDMHRREKQLKDLLDTLRIQAESVVVPWDHVVCHAPQDPRYCPLSLLPLID